MAGVDVDRVGPVQVWAGPLQEWLDASTVSQERSLRTVLAFGRYSDWVSGRGLGAQDVDEDLIDEYIGLERKRSGSRVPAAAQYLPLVKRFLSEQGVFVRRPPVSRRREGRPRLRGGPLDEVVLDLVAWLQVEGSGTAPRSRWHAQGHGHGLPRGHFVGLRNVPPLPGARTGTAQHPGKAGRAPLPWLGAATAQTASAHPQALGFSRCMAIGSTGV